MKNNIKVWLYISIAALLYFAVLFSGVLNQINQVAASVIVELFTIPVIIAQLLATFFAIRSFFSKSSSFNVSALGILSISILITIGMIWFP